MTITVDRVGELKDLMIELLWPFVFALCSIVKRGKRDTLTYPDSCITWFHFSLWFYLLLRKRFIFSILIELNWRTENRFKTHQGRYFYSEPDSYILWIVSYYHNVFIEWTPKSRNLCPPRRCHFSRQCGILRMAVARRIYRKFSTSRVDPTITRARFALH